MMQGNRTKKSKKRLWKGSLLIGSVLLVAAIVWGYVQYRAYFLAPTERLALTDYYPEMPPDSSHIYIELPVDHQDPSLGSYKGFYLLSPGFTPKQDVIFYLTDGQQNKVTTQTDFKAFELKLPGMSYVVMGRRGSFPALFPEVYQKDGSVDFKKAMRLYGTEQQIEDIEKVRQDLEKKGFLPPDGRIMLYGTSGAGILIQEYLAKHGEHVSKVMLEATGAPDIAIDGEIVNIGSPFTEMMKQESPETLTKLEDLLSKGRVDKASLCFMLYKIQLYDIDWKRSSIKLIDELADGKKRSYYKNMLNPEYNFTFTKLLMKMPMMESTKVRIFEILGAQLFSYLASPGELNIAFEWEKELIHKYVDEARAGKLDVPIINLTEKRRSYPGEVLLLIGDMDNQFSVKAADVICHAYPKAKRVVVHDTHAMLQNDAVYQSLRKIFFTKGLYSEEMEQEIKAAAISN